jgi:hypothetical protein
VKALLVTALLLPLYSVASAATELSLDDLVKQHLNAIGTEQARAAAKTRVVQGMVRYRVLSAGTHEQSSQVFGPEGSEQTGKEVFVSQANSIVTLLKLPEPGLSRRTFCLRWEKDFNR